MDINIYDFFITIFNGLKSFMDGCYNLLFNNFNIFGIKFNFLALTGVALVPLIVFLFIKKLF